MYNKMSNLPVEINVTLDPKKVEENYICEEALQVLRMIKPNWCSDENSMSSLRTRVSHSKFKFLI